MKSFFRSLLVRSLVFAGLTGAVAQAAGSADSAPQCCRKSEAACCDAAKACCAPKSADSAAYPLDTCVVSGEKLGSMGQPYDHIHRAAGQPDRLVRFCCKGCVRDFKKDPAAYLKKLDEATTAPAKS